MSQFLFSIPQLVTALRLADLTPVPGSPLDGPGDAPLPPDHEGCIQMSAHRLLSWSNGGWRVNRAFALSLAVAAAPDEAVWINAGQRAARFTLCRRGAFAVECSVMPDGLVKWVFPQVWSIIPEIIAGAFDGEHPDAGDAAHGGFEFRGAPAAAFLLSLIAQAAREGEPCRIDTLHAWIDPALADPGRTLPFVEAGCGQSLLTLLPGENQVAEIAMSLIGAGLVNVESGVLRPVDSVATVFTRARASTAISFRRRLFTPDGFATAELTGTRVGSRMLTWSLEPQFPAQPQCHWRVLDPDRFKAEVLRVLGWPASALEPSGYPAPRTEDQS